MADETISCDVLIIGAGVIGLAIASKIADSGSVVIVEANPQFGQETSSRNSEVVHSGIYYPPASQKTQWCIEGRAALYDHCQRRGIGFKKTGKLVVATAAYEGEYLDKLAKNAKNLSVPHVRLTKTEAENLEPLIRCESALLFPESGIVDSHALMADFEVSIENRGGMIAYGHRVVSIEGADSDWKIRVSGPAEDFTIKTPIVVNAAGLNAARLSNEALGTTRYEHRFCRGRYFSVSGKYKNSFGHLVYPVPQKDGLGIHVTIDLEGFVRLGPDVDWCSQSVDAQLEYRCDWDSLELPFLNAVNRYFPELTKDHVSPGLIGIRPKLFIDGTAHPDFLVEAHGSFIHCLGIESPGLTSSLIIAAEVEKKIHSRKGDAA
jgi:L-2-hydroxyglutarate oxidase LhgO